MKDRLISTRAKYKFVEFTIQELTLTVYKTDVDLAKKLIVEFENAIGSLKSLIGEDDH